MVLKEPLDSLSVGAGKAKSSDADGRKLLRSVRKMKSSFGGLHSAVGGHTSLRAKSFYTNNSPLEFRRAVVKARIVQNRSNNWHEQREKHIDYIQRRGVSEEGGRGELFSMNSDMVNGAGYLDVSKEDKHEFRFIIAPEASNDIDLKWLTREVIKKMENDLNTKLQWAAVDHYNTDNPHVHVVMRGVADDGSILRISRDYISNGIRNRTREILTRELGLKSGLEIQNEYAKEVTANRFTAIDKFIKLNCDIDASINLKNASTNLNEYLGSKDIERRLKWLGEMGLSKQVGAHSWKLDSKWEGVLRENGMRNDIIKTMNREMKLSRSDCEIYSRGEGRELAGRIVWRGIHEEMSDRQYIVVRDDNRKNHYVVLDRFSLQDGIGVGDNVVISMRSREDYLRKADTAINGFARNNSGIYDSKDHLDALRKTLPGKNEETTKRYVKLNEKRLVKLSKIGVVEPKGEGRWKIPSSFMADVQRVAQSERKILRVQRDSRTLHGPEKGTRIRRAVH